MYKRATLYVPTGSENAYYTAIGWSEFTNIQTYDPTKITYTLKIKHGNIGSTTQNVQSGERFALTIDDMENVQYVSFNGRDVTADVVNCKYITPEINANSEIIIGYASAPANDDIDGDGSFTISDITELIKRYLNTGE